MIRSSTSLLAAPLMLAFAAAPLAAQTTFGSQPGMTFGGTGISNSSVVSNANAGTLGVTLGLTATPRCYLAPPQTCGPAVTNDGVNTFFAQPGQGQFYGPNYLSMWNFDFAAIGANVDDYVYTLSYDTNPATGNGTTGSFGVPFPPYPYCPLVVCFINIQDSENLGFFDSSFDPNASGEYEFDLTANDPTTGAQVASTQMFVDVGTTNVVPEPATMSLLAVGLVGLAGAERKRRRARRKR